MKFKLAFDDSLTKVFSAAIDLCQISSNSVDDQKTCFRLTIKDNHAWDIWLSILCISAWSICLLSDAQQVTYKSLFTIQDDRNDNNEKRKEKTQRSIVARQNVTLEFDIDHSLDFTFKRLFMKLFRTKSIDVVKDCQYVFGAVLPSVLVLKKADKLALRYQCLENAFCTYYTTLFHQSGSNRQRIEKLN